MKNSRPQILYLVHRVPHPPNRGDRIRSFHILDFLSQHGDVHLATLADEPVSNETLRALRVRCKNVVVEQCGTTRWIRGAASLLCGRSATAGLFQSPRLRRVIRQWAKTIQFDASVTFCSSMGQYLSLPELHRVPAIVDLVDVDSEKLLQYAQSAAVVKRWLYRLEGARLRRLEKELTGRATAVTLVSEPEAQLWRNICPNDHTLAVPNGVDLDYFQPARSEGRPARCVFVGALDYPPNVEGVCWFARHVWPEVHRRCPAATFAIVGRCPHPAVRQLANVSGIEVIGSVPDVRPHLAQATVAVAPLRIARGIQNKVLEAMASLRAVVASPQALEGLPVGLQRPLEIAETAEEWAEKILYLLTNHSARIGMAAAARRYVENKHVWPECLSPLNTLLDRCISHTPSGANQRLDSRAPSAVSAIA